MKTYAVLFSIMSIGYLLGRVRFFGVGLGTSALLIVALFFGHFGFELPLMIRNIGLICFVTSVGLIAGPSFFRNIRKNAAAYICTGIAIVLTGAVLCSAVIFLSEIPAPLVIGLFAGSATSTPGLAAATEATGDILSSIGYGIAYPFGIISIVLFVQVIPRLYGQSRYETDHQSVEKEVKKEQGISIDRFGFFPFSLTVLVGLLIAEINIPLSEKASFNMGMAGGPLISGLLFGHIRKIGRLSLKVNGNTLNTIREFGLALFLSGAGIEAGRGFLDTVSQYGIILLLLGVLFSIVPTLSGFFLAKRVFRLELFDALGCVCGGQTSTPALGALIETSGSDQIASSYAAAYPVALITVIVSVQILAMLYQ